MKTLQLQQFQQFQSESRRIQSSEINTTDTVKKQPPQTMNNQIRVISELKTTEPDMRDDADASTEQYLISKKNSANSGLDLATAVRVEAINMKSADLRPSETNVKVKVRRRNIALAGPQRTEYDYK